MSVYLPGKYIKGRWVARDYYKYSLGGYPSEDEVKPTLSWRIAEAWKAFRGKPTLQERMTAAAPEMYELLHKCTNLEEPLKSEVEAVIDKIANPPTTA